MSTVTAVLADRFFSDRTGGEHAAPADNFLDLSDRSGTALALHHAERVQPGATSHKDCQRYAFVSEFPWRAPVSLDRHQCSDAGHSELDWAAPKSGRRRHLSILFRWSSPAESADREFQHSRRCQAISVR